MRGSPFLRLMLRFVCSVVLGVLFSNRLVLGDPGYFAARLLPGEFASERWELFARFDSGHLLVAQFLVTNMGLGDRNAVALGYLVGPGGEVRRFRNGRREGRWKLSPDRLRMEVGSSVLDLGAEVQRLQVQKRRIRLDLRFRCRGPAHRWDQKEGMPYTLVLLDLAAPIEGTLWVKGMKERLRVYGRVALTHSWMDRAESQLLLRRLEFFSLQEQGSLYLADFLTSQKTCLRWVVIQQGGRRVLKSLEPITLSFEGKAEGASRLDYAVPGALRWEGPGIQGHADLREVLLRYNPLEDLPQPFRFLVQLKMRPHWVWIRSPFEVSFKPRPDSHSLRIRGVGITLVSFSQPLRVFPCASAS